jgi:hypothetical protein
MLIAVSCLYSSWHLPFGKISAPDAGFFPRALSILLLLFGAAITVGSFLSRPEPASFGARPWSVAIAAGAFVTYGLTVQNIGYPVAMLLILLLLTRGLGRMSWKRSLLISVPCVALSFLGLSKLGVPLPTGILPL